jgi:putative membrane protein
MATSASDLPGPAPQPSGFFLPRWLLVTLGGIAVLAVGFVLGRIADGRGHRRFGDLHGHAGHPALRFVVVLVVLTLVVAAIVALVRHFSAAAKATPVGGSAEQLLAERFARGEIDEAEFVRRRDALRS